MSAPAPRGHVLSCTVEEYHLDPCAEPSLSSSIAKILVDESPAHAYLAHPRFGGASHVATKAMNAGTLVHKLLLGKGAEVVELDFPDYRTKAAQAARDEAIAAKRTPMLKHDAEEIHVAVRAIRSQLDALGIVLNGESEVPVTWQEEVFLTDHHVTCRAMFDHVLWGHGVIFDVKKIVSANPETIVRQMSTYGYDVQWAAYTSAMRAIRPELAGREEFTFLFCEAEAPYAVTPVQLDGQFRALGEARWRRAVRLWHECTTTGHWPAYTSEVIQVSPAPWAMMREGL